jgi:hypothetical protein
MNMTCVFRVDVAIRVLALLGISAVHVATAGVTRSAFEDGTEQTQQVLVALAKAEYRFTPEVRAAYLAWNKAHALADLAKTGQSLPDEFLAWVDSEPVVAATVYGIADNAAQRLVLLRSLDLDLGPEESRHKHLQLALAITDAHAGLVNPATMSNPAKGVSLTERGLLRLEIKRFPCARVDTHAQDRPLDMNDHIINFLEDHPVVTAATNSRPTYAYEVYSNPERLKQFNAYMTERGFPMNLDCGKGSIIPGHWGGGRDVTRAYKLFRAAYEEKGRLPKARDPSPTPSELAAYLIRNDNYRFPAGVKRGWPKFPLNAPWPVLDYLVRSGESLREREFIWTRFRDHGIAIGYGAYIGQIAQYPDLVKARKLQPFDFTYDTYPMRLKDGGVCGTCSNIGRGLSIALGIPACQASQPSHSCFVAVGGNELKGFGLSIGQSIAGPGSTQVSGRGPFANEAMRFYPVNYGLLPFLESQIALAISERLPAATPAGSRHSLLQSAFEINPYNFRVVSSILTGLTNSGDLVRFARSFEATLSAVNKPGCPKQGCYSSAVQKALEVQLTRLPPPADPADLNAVIAFLDNRGDALWLRYQLVSRGLPELKDRLTAELKASLEGNRTPQGCQLLSNRIAATGGAIKDLKERQDWAAELLSILGDRTMYTVGEGRKAREYADPCSIALRTLAGNSPGARAGFEQDLRAAVEGVRTAAGCDLFCKRMDAITGAMCYPKERKAWADALLDIMDGHETYASPSAPTKPTLDPLVNHIYALGCDLDPAKERLAADLKASVAGTRTPVSVGLLNQRLALLSRYVRKATDRKAWAESVLAIVAGHETYTVPLPRNQGAREVDDPCAVQIYRLLGKKTPQQEKAEADKRAAAATTAT